MRYYKIIIQDKVVDIATEESFIEYQVKNKLLLFCTRQKGQYLQGNAGALYRSTFMTKVITDEVPYQQANIVEIDKEEYNILVKTFETNEEILIEQPEPEPIEEEIFIDPIEEATIDFIRTSKLAEMNSTCNKTITKGFDIALSDGNSYHFSLTTQDQLNLITLASMVEGGETQIPYHADGEPCKFYSVEDINAIITKATKFKTYHISYFNSLKIYINSMETKEEIAAVTYGTEIPEEYQSEVLKNLI